MLALWDLLRGEVTWYVIALMIFYPVMLLHYLLIAKWADIKGELSLKADYLTCGLMLLVGASVMYNSGYVIGVEPEDFGLIGNGVRAICFIGAIIYLGLIAKSYVGILAFGGWLKLARNFKSDPDSIDEDDMIRVMNTKEDRGSEAILVTLVLVMVLNHPVLFLVPLVALFVEIVVTTKAAVVRRRFLPEDKSDSPKPFRTLDLGAIEWRSHVQPR